MKKKDYTNTIDAPESDYLYIASSQIPKAGKGLYTAVNIYKDEVISIFKGEILTEKQIDIRIKKNKDKYFIKMPDGSIMDSMNTRCFAKYANDAKILLHSPLKLRNNAKITLDDDDQVCLIATRNIKAGEEIFCSYGKSYWNKHSLSLQL